MKCGRERPARAGMSIIAQENMEASHAEKTENAGARDARVYIEDTRRIVSPSRQSLGLQLLHTIRLASAFQHRMWRARHRSRSMCPAGPKPMLVPPSPCPSNAATPATPISLIEIQGTLNMSSGWYLGEGRHAHSEFPLRILEEHFNLSHPDDEDTPMCCTPNCYRHPKV